MPTSKRKAWSRLSRSIICKTPYLQLREDQVVRPTGDVRPYYVVDRQDFAIIIPRFTNGDFLMVRQYRYPIARYTWEFPMGMAPTKTMLQAAKLELKQETGHTARHWKCLGTTYIAPGMTSQKAYIYLAQDLVPGPAEPESDEFIVLKRFSSRFVRTKFETHKWNDGPSLIAWLFFNHSNKK